MNTYDFKQYSPEWWAIRRGLPTASEAHRIVTPAKGELSKSADAFAYELLAQPYDPQYGVMDGYVSDAMKNGSLMEPEARACYEFQRNAKVHQVGFCTTDDGRAGCSPDALIGNDGGLECKSPAPKTHIEYLMNGGLPVEYKPQVHWSMIVTGRNWWDFMSYTRGLPSLIVRVEADEYTEKVRAAMLDFLDKLDTMRAKLRAMVGDMPVVPEKEFVF